MIIFSVTFFELNNHIKKGAILIDIRSYNEFLSYHIPHSTPIQAYKILPRNKPIIFVCDSGKLAQNYALHYRQYYYEAYYLEGGIRLYLEMNKQQPYF